MHGSGKKFSRNPYSSHKTNAPRGTATFRMMFRLSRKKFFDFKKEDKLRRSHNNINLRGLPDTKFNYLEDLVRFLNSKNKKVTPQFMRSFTEKELGIGPEGSEWKRFASWHDKSDVKKEILLYAVKSERFEIKKDLVWHDEDFQFMSNFEVTSYADSVNCFESAVVTNLHSFEKNMIEPLLSEIECILHCNLIKGQRQSFKKKEGNYRYYSCSQDPDHKTFCIREENDVYSLNSLWHNFSVAQVKI